MLVSSTSATSLLICTLALSLAHLTAAAPVSGSNASATPSFQRRGLLDDIKKKLGIEDWDDLGCKALGTDDMKAYAPVRVDCPSDATWIRPADSLSRQEQDYLNKRKPMLEANWKTRMKDDGLLQPLPRTPVVALALSGGGYRAMMSGSGMAFLQNHTHGSVGDLLGVSSYVSGLSGGSWALSSFYVNNGIDPLTLARETWDLSSNLVFPGVTKAPGFYRDLHCKADEKEELGFQTQVTDYWALALCNHLFPKQYHSGAKPNLRWSDIPKIAPKVEAAELPWPIIVAIERDPGATRLDENSTIYEFNLAEFGAWSWGTNPKSQGAFTPVRHLGTKLQDGQPVDKKNCWEGFDNAGFVAGTSSSLFNGELIKRLQNKNLTDLGFDSFDGFTDQVVTNILKVAHNMADDVAVYPNPFYKWKDSPRARHETLDMVDGGMAKENIPLEPFLQDSRHVDAIFAFDNSMDGPNRWPTGIALYSTYLRVDNQSKRFNQPQRMTQIPTAEAFVNAGMNTRPVFFGCENPNLPTIIYVPNYSWSTDSNHDTMKLKYSLEETLATVENGRRALDLNGTIEGWSQCLTCAMVDNAVLQSGQKREENCEKCMKRWCWDGNADNTAGKIAKNVLGQLPSLPL